MKRLYAGLFLISLTTLALEISLVRLFSIGQWYHFAFMIVSIAMFGLAGAGTFLAIRKLNNPLPISSILFALTTFGGFFIVNQLSFDPFKAVVSPWHTLTLLLYYILLGLPFFFSGIIITFSSTKFQSLAGKIYFYNLAGAGLGALVILPLISLAGDKTILWLTIIGLVASFFFIQKHWLIMANLIILIFFGLLTVFVPFQIKISPYKELNQALNFPQAKILETRWNSFSRLDVIKSPYVRYAPGLSMAFQKDLPEQIGLSIDGSGLNAITKNENLEFLDYLPNQVAFTFKENSKTLVLNAGAGLDVLLALQNSQSVEAVESNPIVIDLLKTKYPEFSGRIYQKAKVINDEGRGFIQKAGKYDVIILSQVGQMASQAAGLYSLSENYLFTKEAFQDYYDHLTDDGVLVITRWLLYPPRETFRLFSLALTIPEAKNKIAMFNSWTTVTLLLFKNDLTSEKIEKIKQFSEAKKFDLIYLPPDLPNSTFTPNQYAQFEEPYYYNGVQQILKNKNEFYKNYLFDVSPTTDEKPFYFNFFKWSKIKELFKIIGTNWQPFFDSGFLLWLFFIQAVILSLIFILLPIGIFRKMPIQKKSLIYFFCLGLGYLFVEIVFIQKFILFLGQAIYATSMVIFAMLIFSSLGSLSSQKVPIKKLPWLITILAILIIIYLLLLPTVLNALMTLNLAIKTILAIIIIVPLAFVMGVPFPLGLRSVKQELIPWAWAVNGSASVLSTIIAILIALSTGYSFVLVLAAVIYFVGMWFVKPLTA